MKRNRITPQFKFDSDGLTRDVVFAVAMIALFILWT
jgi:hypothetical protein